MTFHMDLLVREGQHFIVKCPQFPSWRYKQHGHRHTLQTNASASLLEHLAKVARFQFWGWDEQT